MIDSSRAAGIWVGALLLVGAVAGSTWLRLGLPIPACRFREWTGLPCATCGSTRMARALLAGDIASAVAFNPLVFASLVVLAGWSLRSTALAVVGRPARPIAIGAHKERALLVGAAIAFALGWAYQIWRDV